MSYDSFARSREQFHKQASTQCCFYEFETATWHWPVSMEGPIRYLKMTLESTGNVVRINVGDVIS
jgi:hypothetical protein